MISTKRVFGFLVGCFLASQFPSVVSATLIALSENDSSKGLIKSTDGLAPEASYVGELDPVFHGLGAGDMVFSATDDAYVAKPGGSSVNANNNLTHLGTNGSSRILIKFDLSSIPSNATINKAQLQFWGHTGNATLSGTAFGAITTHNWSEGLVTANSPIGTSNTPEWGTGADAVFDIGAGLDVPVSSAVDLTQNSNNLKTNFLNDDPGFPFTLFLTQVVTTDLQTFVDGSAPNYGWGFDALNYVFSSSENTETIQRPDNANFGTQTRPVLFVDYTAVPEPSSFLMFSVLALGLSRTRVWRARS